jgi:MFS family permease
MPPTQTLFAELRTLPRAFWVLFAGMFINRFGTFVYPFLTIILHRRGYSYAEIGLAVGAFGCGGLGAALAGGWFTDRFGRRNAIVVGTSAQALFIFLIYFVQALPVLVLLTTLAGFMGGFFHPAGSALIADLVPPRLRLRAFSALRLAINAGFAFGTAAGGILVSHSAFWLFAGDALTTLAYGMLAFWLLPHGLRQNREQARWRVALAHLQNDRRFWALAFVQFCTAMIFAQTNSTYALEVVARGQTIHLGQQALAPEQIFGLLLGWNGVLIVLCELSLTRQTQRFQPRHVMCVGYVLMGGGLALNAIPDGLPVMFAGITLFTFGEMLTIPTSSAWAAHLAPEAMRGRYLGALSLAWSLASVLGPTLGLQLFGAHRAWLWLGCGVLGIIAALVFGKYGDRQELQDIGSASSNSPIQ